MSHTLKHYYTKSIQKAEEYDDSFVLSLLYNKVGKIDILLDDGGHYNKQQIITLNSSIPNITDGGMIVVEDCHASYMSEFGNPSKFSFMNFSKYIIDKINQN